MRLRHQVFHTYAELNIAVRDLMHALNQREMRQLGASRQALFEMLDKPALKLLPVQPYLYTETKRAKVGPDYHIQYKQHYYSVPHPLVGEHVELEASSRLVKIYHQGNLVAQHPSSDNAHGQSTIDMHMPSNHQHQKWTPQRLLSWAENIGSAQQSLMHSYKARHIQSRLTVAV